MDTVSDFFARNIVTVYFLYGLSFFSMGLGILLEIGHSSELEFARALRPLSGFGLVHGGHEWLEMFLLIMPGLAFGWMGSWLAPFRLFLLASSFLMLIAFGSRLISGTNRAAAQRTGLGIVLVVWAAGLAWILAVHTPGEGWIQMADVYTRYALAIPGAALTVWGLLLQRRRFIQMGMPAFGRDVAMAALAFGLYGGIGQLFASPTDIFLSEIINAEAFMRWFGFPIQVFRAAMATLAAVFIIRSLRSFEVENRRRMEALRHAQQTERARLETLRSELLHRTVKAQESERQRIARELHDETGQTLTALGMGLRGLADTIASNPQRAAGQARELEGLAVGGVEELQRLIGGLHPPQLDDFGLPAALRWYAGEIKNRYGLPVVVTSIGNSIDLPIEVRTVFFRIAQEAITNTVRHAQATQATLTIETEPDFIRLEVQDNGRGFDPEIVLKGGADRPCWGLFGIQERAVLIGADCRIISQPGCGTRIEVVLRHSTESHG